MANILVIEDDHDIREALSECLAEAGHEVAAVSEGAEALRWLEKRAPDLIVLDLMMPGMSGAQFRARQIADPVLKAIPVLVLTAATARRHQSLGVDGATLLPKPVDLEELLGTVELLVHPH